MLKNYNIYYVRFSDETGKYFAAVNMEHALFTANLFLDTEYPEDYKVDVVYISLDSHISSLLIYKSE